MVSDEIFRRRRQEVGLDVRSHRVLTATGHKWQPGFMLSDLRPHGDSVWDLRVIGPLYRSKADADARASHEGIKFLRTREEPIFD